MSLFRTENSLSLLSEQITPQEEGVPEARIFLWYLQCIKNSGNLIFSLIQPQGCTYQPKTPS